MSVRGDGWGFTLVGVGGGARAAENGAALCFGRSRSSPLEISIATVESFAYKFPTDFTKSAENGQRLADCRLAL